MEGFKFKYGEEEWSMGGGTNGNGGKWCIGRARDWGNKWGNRGGRLQQTGTNGHQGKGEHSREKPHWGDKGSLDQWANLENRTGVH